MIVYDLVCKLNHRFEGWFSNRADFDSQKEHGMLVCPVCGDAQVEKLPSASRLNLKHSSSPSASPEVAHNPQSPPGSADPQVLLNKIKSYIYTHYEDVGSQFAEEAKKIHYGEVEPRNIRGQATAREVGALLEEGIEALPLPTELADDKKKLN